MTIELKEHLIAEKAKKQPHFTLLAQDITADLLVDMWVVINDYIQDCKHETSPQEVVQWFREQWQVGPTWKQPNMSPVVQQASFIAEEMRRYPTRKIAD